MSLNMRVVLKKLRVIKWDEVSKKMPRVVTTDDHLCTSLNGKKNGFFLFNDTHKYYTYLNQCFFPC